MQKEFSLTRRGEGCQHEKTIRLDHEISRYRGHRFTKVHPGILILGRLDINQISSLVTLPGFDTVVSRCRRIEAY
jgi:hypothetical protein